MCGKNAAAAMAPVFSIFRRDAEDGSVTRPGSSVVVRTELVLAMAGWETAMVVSVKLGQRISNILKMSHSVSFVTVLLHDIKLR